ncbi:unnamed protein product [Symbiodinium sp. CCMP2592]|nr:unnamed protein product [Symbiodinium sp. CCMP2592]
MKKYGIRRADQGEGKFESLKSFLWTVVLLLILMYCVAVYFTELAFDLQHKHPDRDFSSVRQSWGSIGSSILSLFQAITGGDDWQNFILVFRDVSGESSLVNTLVFSLFIAFATLAPASACKPTTHPEKMIVIIVTSTWVKISVIQNTASRHE